MDSLERRCADHPVGTPTFPPDYQAARVAFRPRIGDRFVAFTGIITVTSGRACWQHFDVKSSVLATDGERGYTDPLFLEAVLG